MINTRQQRTRSCPVHLCSLWARRPQGHSGYLHWFYLSDPLRRDHAGQNRSRTGPEHVSLPGEDGPGSPGDTDASRCWGSRNAAGSRLTVWPRISRWGTKISFFCCFFTVFHTGGGGEGCLGFSRVGVCHFLPATSSPPSENDEPLQLLDREPGLP